MEASIFEDLYKDYRHLHGVGRAKQVQFIVIGLSASTGEGTRLKEGLAMWWLHSMGSLAAGTAGSLPLPTERNQ